MSDSGSDEDVSSVLLALPDGPMSAEDAKEYSISHIGGYPSFPPVPKGKPAAPAEVQCGACGAPMPLLAQVYAPLVDGENDRTLYAFGCPRHACRRKEGSVKAFRASVRNEAYVADVAAKRAEAERKAAEERERARKNPFTASAPAEQAGGLFGSGQPLFGAAAPNPFAAPAPTSTPTPAPAKEEPPAAKMEQLSLGEPTVFTPPLPAYLPPQYLATIDEYLPEPESDDSDIESDDEEPEGQKAEWRDADGWDKILPKSVDDVFEKFVRRLETAEDGSTQVLRYDFGAVPLAYQSTSTVFKTLFPGAPTKKPSSEDEDPNLAEFYTEKSVPKCSRCGAKRTFEYQLVPQLINHLRPGCYSTTGEKRDNTKKAMSEEERKRELERIAKGDDANDDGVADMEWGSIFVFGCEGDCVGVGEEFCLVDWEALAQ